MGFFLIRTKRVVKEFVGKLKGIVTHEKVVIRDALYPTFYATYPFEKDTVELIQSYYGSHIIKARGSLDYSDADFDKIIRPIIVHVIKYFMALPASERHHHTDRAASMFYHSLQTANIAVAKYNSASVVPLNIKIEDKKDYIHAACVATFLAALLHDAGKLFSDMKVYPSDEKGNLIDVVAWDPIGESLYDYCVRNEVAFYRVKFNQNRKHNAHNAFISRFVNTMPPFPEDYHCGSQILILLDGILFGSKEPHLVTLSRLIKEADSHSVKMDFQRFSRPVQSDNLSVLIMDAIRNHIEYYPNLSPVDPRSVIFRSNLGVHIPYPDGLEEIINFSRALESQISEHVRTKIPDATRLVKVLNESGYLQHHYYQTTARTPQYTRTIKFEFGGRIHTKEVLLLRPLEIVALLPTNQIVTASYSDGLMEDMIASAESAHRPWVNNANEYQDRTAVRNNETSEHTHSALEPLGAIENTLSSDTLDQVLDMDYDVNIELMPGNPEAQISVGMEAPVEPIEERPEAINQTPNKDEQAKTEIQLDKVSKTKAQMPVIDETSCFDTNCYKKFSDDWLENPIIDVLDKKFSDCDPRYTKADRGWQIFLMELCASFVKGYIKPEFNTEFLQLVNGNLLMSQSFLLHLNEHSLNPDPIDLTFKLEVVINNINDKDFFVTKREINRKIYYELPASISEVILGDEYQNYCDASGDIHG